MQVTPPVVRLLAALAEYQPGPDLREETIGLAHFRDLLDLTLAKQAAQLAQSELWDDDGYTSPVAWLRHQTKMAGGVAADRVVVGLNLEAVPQSVAAMEAGEIGFAHLALIARLAESIRPASLDERRLLARAKKQTVTRFRRTCEHARHAQDPAGFAAEEAERHEARFLELSRRTTAASGCAAGSQPRPARCCARRWSRWPGPAARATTGAGPSGWPTPSSKRSPSSTRPSCW